MNGAEESNASIVPTDGPEPQMSLVPASGRSATSALVVTVGGSPAQVAVSIRFHRPAFICWLCSEQSVEQIPSIVANVGFDGDYPRPPDSKTLVRDADDIVECYVGANRAVRTVLKERGFEPRDVVADITGGTKAMSATLALAALNDGLRLSYVGGTGRTKWGVGIVIDGTEVVRTVENPWRLFAVDELHRMARRFNGYEFGAVEELAASVVERPGSPPEIRSFARLVGVLASAYGDWDRFEHKRAVEKLKEVQKAITTARELGQFESVRDFFDAVGRNVSWLQDLQQKSGGFKYLLVEPVFVDLVANARRRAEEGKCDDAVARLYRSIELLAQIALKRRGIDETGKVDPMKVPESIRADYVARYSGRDGHLLLPLYASYELLRAFGDDLGQRFDEQRGEIEKILAARNRSILAHGTQPVGKAAFDSLLAKVLALYGADADIPFPKLEL